MAEVLSAHQGEIDSSNVLNELGLEKGKYFVISLHREENLDIGDNFKIICESINKVAEIYKMPIIFSVHPRTRKKIDTEKIKFDPLIKDMPAMGFFEYNALQKNAFCVLSDSGTICEESTIQHFPAVSVRTAEERPEGLDAGTLLLGGIKPDELLNAIKIATETKQDNDIAVPDYCDTNVSDKVLKIITSYTRIVNDRTWKKS
jgi:UDP-N-acetylglucosamine 2-epimerase (non-hydrolysing)